MLKLAQTNQPTDQPTDQQTGQKQYVPHYYSGGHKNIENQSVLKWSINTKWFYKFRLERTGDPRQNLCRGLENVHPHRLSVSVVSAKPARVKNINNLNPQTSEPYIYVSAGNREHTQGNCQ
ncbi:hypothetical protein DPMN_021672 [Dreissena polymorpha]|uniref:Uncharacterized protein n=1 Tax=Dreissena polymorpha TaxID=45954 RepID=A0A9D4NPD3_DREPO|nr:hypothetical protein DPMN_021672 [Dreissena polymorpha]